MSRPPARPDEDSDVFLFLGSMEGVPDWADATETDDEAERLPHWGRRANHWLGVLGTLLPGLVLALGLAAAGRRTAGWLGDAVFGMEASPISPILIAIVLGLALRNLAGLPAVYELGLQLALRRILRIGVALLGIQLSLAALGTIGAVALPIVVACIALALGGVGWIAARLGLPARLGVLIGVGTAICGNTAIVATAPVIGADDDETSYATGCITVFGLLALLVYPLFAHALFDGDARMAGFFLGAAIHDTAQVAGAGLMYLQQYGTGAALETAMVTKMVRNTLMIVVIPFVAWRFQRGERAGAGGRLPLATAVPGFVVAFVGLALLRTLGDLGSEPFGGLLSPERWQTIVETLSMTSTWCLTVAMAAVGLGTNLRRLRRLGLRPLAAGFLMAGAVGALAAVLVRALAPYTAG